MFLVVLIIMSLISIKISDWVLDAPVGPFDRTLGFFYGVVRGLLLVVIAYFFYDLFVPREKQEEVVRRRGSCPSSSRCATPRCRCCRCRSRSASRT